MSEKDLEHNDYQPDTGTPDSQSADLYMDSLMEQIRSDIEGIRSNKKPDSDRLPAKKSPKDRKGNPDNSDSRVKKRTLWLVLLLLLLVPLLLFLHQSGVFKVSQENPLPSVSAIVPGELFPGTGDAEDGTLGDMTQEEIEEQMQKEADKAYFSYKINSRIVFENGNSEGKIGIENPNYNVYPIVVRIYLGEDDTGEMIYDSGGMLPNQHIDKAKLEKVLEAGEYKATAYLYAYDPETKANIFKTTAELTVIINH